MSMRLIRRLLHSRCSINSSQGFEKKGANSTPRGTTGPLCAPRARPSSIPGPKGPETGENEASPPHPRGPSHQHPRPPPTRRATYPGPRIRRGRRRSPNLRGAYWGWAGLRQRALASRKSNWRKGRDPGGRVRRKWAGRGRPYLWPRCVGATGEYFLLWSRVPRGRMRGAETQKQAWPPLAVQPLAKVMIVMVTEHPLPDSLKSTLTESSST